MARELCDHERQLRDSERNIWPLGVSPYSHAKTLVKHRVIEQWCDKCDSHSWVRAWTAAHHLWCRVCHRKSSAIFNVAQGGVFCSEACYAFI